MGFRQLSTASVSDAVDRVVGKIGFLPESIIQLPNEKKIFGPAVTGLESSPNEFLPSEYALDAID